MQTLMIFRFNTTVIGLLMAMSSMAQVISDLHSISVNDFTYWEVYTDDQGADDDSRISLAVSTLGNQGIKLWEIDTDEYGNGDIRQRWKNKNDTWQINFNGDIITARIKWTGDYKSWSINYDGETYDLEKTGRAYNEWLLSLQEYPLIEIQTNRQRDITDIYLDFTDRGYPLFDDNPALPLFSSFLLMYHMQITNLAR